MTDMNICSNCGWKYEMGIDHNCKDKMTQVMLCYNAELAKNKELWAEVAALKAEIEAMKDKNLVTVIVDKRDEWPMWHCQECGDEMRYYNSKYTDNKNVCGSCYNKWVDAQNAQLLPPTEEKS